MKFNQLQIEVGEWGRHNFPNAKTYQPLLGVLEEIGELSHAHLKMEQGIRGTNVEHQSAKGDAVADAIVYLAHFACLKNLNLAEIDFKELQENKIIDEPHETLLIASICLGKLCNAYLDEFNTSVQVVLLVLALANYCTVNNINMQYEIEIAWDSVRQRDWIKYPKNGRTE